MKHASGRSNRIQAFPAETAVPEIVSERQLGLPDESLHNDDDGGDSGGETGFVQTAGKCDLSLKSHLEGRLSGQSLKGSIQICVQGSAAYWRRWCQ